MARSMYDAYTAAGRAGGEYKKSLQRITNVGYEREHSAKMYEMDVQSQDSTIGAITEGISLVSNIYGGVQSKKEFGEARTKVQTGIAKKAYGESEVGKAEGATKWEELGEEGQSEWMGKFTPTEKPQEWHEKLFGADKQVRFGEEVKGKEGKDLSEYYSKSDILATGTLSKTTRLEELTNLGTKPDITMNVEAGGVGEDETISDKSGGGDKTEQGFGPSSKMQSMMGEYKNKPGGGWDPSKEDWFQEEFAEGWGWKGGKWQ